MTYDKKKEKKDCLGALAFLKEYKLECFSCPYLNECKKIGERERKQWESQ